MDATAAARRRKGRDGKTKDGFHVLGYTIAIVTSGHPRLLCSLHAGGREARGAPPLSGEIFPDCTALELAVKCNAIKLWGL
ncbi:hypothetical protein [Streptomyces olindensis]|uniref:hypothetical protein n=1 Tax=Streptomyces olindensis TaxID=358823 RepID=UPI003656E743